MTQEGPLRGAVPSSYVRLLYDYLGEQNHDALTVLGEPAPVELPHSTERFPVARWKMLLERAASALDDPLLGLRLGQRITPAHFGLMGYVLLACEHLGAAMQRLREYERLFYDVSRLRVHEDGNSLVLEWGTEHGRPGALVDETAITALVTLARDMTGAPQMRPERIEFVNPAPADTTLHAAILGCEVAFERSCTRVILPAYWLAMPLRHPDPHLLALLRSQASEQLQRLPQRGDLGAAIRAEIPGLLQQGRADAHAVAKRLHLSTRSLHRRLAEEGLSFRTLRDECFYQLAREYLADPRLQLSEIAQLLGYSEQSAFTRAFRRWSGRAPHRYRRALEAESCSSVSTGA